MEMANPSIRWLRRIGITIIVAAALTLPLALVVAMPDVTAAVGTGIAKLIPRLSQSLVVVFATEAILLLVAGIWWLWWLLPRRQLHKLDLQIQDPKARADTEDNFRKTVGQALGGAAVLIGAVVAYVQFSQQQQTAAQQIVAQQKATADQIAAQQSDGRPDRRAAEDGVRPDCRAVADLRDQQQSVPKSSD